MVEKIDEESLYLHEVSGFRLWHISNVYAPQRNNENCLTMLI